MQKITPRKSEKSLRSSRYSGFHSDEEEETRTKESFLQQKLKQSIDSHLDSWKQNKSGAKSVISYSQPKKVYPDLFNHRKNHSQRQESPKPQEIQNTVKENLSNLEEIFEIVQRILNHVEDSEDSSLNLRFCQANLRKILNILEEEIKNSKLLLKFLENFIQKQVLEVNSMRKLAEKQREEEIQDLTVKFECTVEELVGKNHELMERNQELGERNKELTERNQELGKRNQELGGQLRGREKDQLETKILSLERLLTESDRQVLEKIDELNEKNEEISKLKQYTSNLTQDLAKVKADMKDLESYLQFQQENSQSQIKQLLTEIDKLQKDSEKFAKTSEKHQADLKHSAESYKHQFNKVYSALSRADEQLEHVQSTFHKKESLLKQENFELQTRNESLEKLVQGLKKDLDLSQDRIEARAFIVAKCKDEEIHRLSETVSRLHEEISALYKSNKELSVLTQRLEERLLKASQSRVHTPTRSDKKLNRNKKLCI